MKKQGKKKIQNAEEPEAGYQVSGKPLSEFTGNHIVVHKSIKEANEYDYRYYATLTPEQCLNTVLLMRNAMWPDDNLDNPIGNRIFIDKPWI